MTEPPFDTEAYQNYVDQVNRNRDKNPKELINILMQLGFKLDQQLGKIISQLDRILEDDKTS